MQIRPQFLTPYGLLAFTITPDSLVYTLLQKKRNFRNVAFLLEKSETQIFSNNY